MSSDQSICRVLPGAQGRKPVLPLALIHTPMRPHATLWFLSLTQGCPFMPAQL